MTPEEIKQSLKDGTLCVGLTDKGRERLRILNIHFNREKDLKEIVKRMEECVFLYLYAPVDSQESKDIKQSLREAALKMIDVLANDDDSTRPVTATP